MTFNEDSYEERTAAVGVTPVAQTADQRQIPAAVIATPPVVSGRVRRVSSSHFEPDAIIAALVGLALLLLGLIAAVRAGFEGDMADPVVEVVGFSHTTTLGLIEIALGVCLVIAGIARSRSGAMFFGAALGIAGFVGAVQSESFEESLAIESSMAWLAVIAGVVVVLAALMMPRYARNSTVIEQV